MRDEELVVRLIAGSVFHHMFEVKCDNIFRFGKVEIENAEGFRGSRN